MTDAKPACVRRSTRRRMCEATSAGYPGRVDFLLPLESDPRAAGHARQAVKHKLTEWGHTNCLDDALLVVSELVANAIRHGGSPVALHLMVRTPVVLIGVQDGSPTTPPTPRALTDTHTGGRGMHLISAVCKRWWWYQCEKTKIVWAEIPLAA